MAKNIPWIKIKCTILDEILYFLIDSATFSSYISCHIVEKCMSLLGDKLGISSENTSW